MTVAAQAGFPLVRDDDHRYWNGMRELIGVSATIETLVEKSPWYEDWHRERGSLVHAALELLLLDQLDRDELDPILEPYVQAAEKFLAATGFDPVHVEVPIGCLRRGFAGTPDLLARPRGRGVKALDVIDFKTGGRLPVHGLQTAMYAILAESFFGYRTSGRRFTVHLSSDAKFRVEEYTDPYDFKASEGLFEAVAWRRYHLGR